MASYRVLCTLVNASSSINGVAFIATRRGMLSEIIPLEQAKAFASIRGYELLTQDDLGQLLVGARTRHQAGRRGWSPDTFSRWLGVAQEPTQPPPAATTHSPARPQPAPAPARALFAGYDAIEALIASVTLPEW
jgi:hypothetical protein